MTESILPQKSRTTWVGDYRFPDRAGLVTKSQLYVQLLLTIALFLLVLAPAVSASPDQANTTPDKQTIQSAGTIERQPDNPIFGKNEPDIQPAQSPNNRELGILGTGIQASGALLLILASILAIAFLLKRFLPRQFGTVGGSRLIQIIESVSLGEKRSLNIVKVAEEHFLIASIPGSVSLLGKVHLPERKEDDLSQRDLLETSYEQDGGAIAQLGRQFRRILVRSLPLKWRFCSSSSKGGQQKLSVSFEEAMNSELSSHPVSVETGPGRYVSRLAEIRKGFQSP